MKKGLGILCAITVGLCAGCFQVKRGVRFEIRLDGPAFPSGFQCVGLVVTGEGIPAQDNPNGTANWQAIYDGGVCPYAGVSTSARAISSTDTSVDLELVVPSGRNRTVQVIGLQTSSGSCPTQKISELLVANAKKELSSDVVGMYELGRRYLDTYHTTAVTIKPTYDATSAKNLLTCDSSSGGGGGGEVNELFPYSTVQLNLNDRYFLRPTGGTAPYSFSLRVGGVSILSQSDRALVQAAGVVDTAIIDVEDSTGKKAAITVKSSNPNVVGTLLYHYSADRFYLTPEEGAIWGSNIWVNRGTQSSYFLSPPSVNGVNSPLFHQGGGPRGNPSVSLPVASFFSGIPMPGLLIGSHSLLAVARRNSGGVSVLCMAGGDCGTPTTQSWLTLGMPGTFAAHYVYNGNASTIGPNGNATTGWYLVVSHFQQSPIQTADLSVGGNSQGPLNHGVVTFALASSASLRLGGLGAIGSESEWELAEIMVIEGSVDTAGPEAALRAKYGLP